MKLNTLKPYAYLFPAFFISGLIVFYPILQILLYSFSEWSFLDSRLTFTLENYKAAFSDEIFWMVLLNNIKVLFNVPIQICIAVIFSSILFEQVKGWKAFQVVYFLPTILPIIVVGIIWTFIYRLDGPLNAFLRLIGLASFTHLWLGETAWSLPSTIAVMIWKDVGFVIMLFLARLLGTPPEIFDAAKIDGANNFQIFLHIKLPQLSSIINIYAVLGIIWSFTDTFNYVYVMTAGGPGYSSTIAEYRIYFQGFKNFEMGYASSLSVIILMIIIFLVFLYFKVRKPEEE